MKKWLLICLTVLISANIYGQDAIKFLGIPVDGFKKDMIAALEKKGYTYNSVFDVLSGEFNGNNVNISVQTVNNRVWRIAIVDAIGSNDETNTIIRYNKLYRQLSQNAKYVRVAGSEIPDNEDISYQITVKNKRYEATFDCKDPSINGRVWYMIAEQYGKFSIVMFYENLNNEANGDDL